MSTPSKVRLGKKAARHDRRTLRLSKYIDRTVLAEPPPERDWTAAVPAGGWGMMLNDRLGICAIACPGHLVMGWTANACGRAKTIPDGDILAAYRAVSGYDPQTGAHDDGCVVLDVLNYWRQAGIGGDRVAAYVQVNRRDHDEVRLAVNEFGGVYLGVLLPASAQGRDAWDVPEGGTSGDGAPGSWGGHAVPALAYDGDGLTVITWGRPLRASWDFLDAYADECYAMISEDWLGDGQTPSGFDVEQLREDLANLR